jgi:predicted ArsR family transcriptional regulator
VPVDDATGPDSGMASDDFDASVTSIAVLAEPVRRALYRFVAAQAEPVSREEAAAGTAVAHHIAKFHLDKLVDDGLLDVEYRRPLGRQVSVSVPERRYELVGQLFARAVTRAERERVPVSQALRQAAQEEGHTLGQVALQKADSKARSAVRDAAIQTLTDCGYEPRVDADGVCLINCPFHSLAVEYTELVCGMNLHLMDGMLSCLDRVGLEAKLDPAPGRGCVRLQNT